MIVDYLENISRYKYCLPRFAEYEATLQRLSTLPLGKHELNEVDFLNVVEGETVATDEAQYEYHRHYLDIQIILEGQEVMKWDSTHRLEDSVSYDEQADIGFKKGNGEAITVKPGMFYIVYPEDAHMPGRHLTEMNHYKKAVVKIKLD